MRQRCLCLMLLGCGLAVCLLAYFTLKPSPYLSDVAWIPAPLAAWADKHGDLRTFVAYFLSGIYLSLFIWLWNRRLDAPRALLLAAMLSVLLGLTEALQTFLPGRVVSFGDIQWGLLGIVLSVGALWALAKWTRPSRQADAPLRITIWGINYAPEVTGIAVYNEMMAWDFSQRGHQVTMLTTFAYYPAWKKLPSDRHKLFGRESMDGVTVCRCWHYVPETVTSAKRFLHEASFVVLSFLRSLFLDRADAMVVVSPPLMLGAAAWCHRCLRGVPYVFHVQDLQPDAAAALGMLNNGWLLKALYQLEAFAYARADRVSGISEGMLAAYRTKGVSDAKLVFFPNPVELPDLETLPARGQFREAVGIAKETFLVVYSGNIGKKQGLEIMITAAEHFKSAPRFMFLICGDGSAKPELEALAAERQLTNLRFLPLQPIARFRQLLLDADINLVPQKAGSGAAFFPSKLLSILALGLPVLTVADANSALKIAIDKGGFGRNVTPDSVASLVEALEWFQSHPEAARDMGIKGRNYVGQFSKDVILTRIENVLRELQT